MKYTQVSTDSMNRQPTPPATLPRGTGFDPAEFCSRKLWDIISQAKDNDCDTEAVEQAVRELTARRHYLDHLERLGRKISRH